VGVGLLGGVTLAGTGIVTGAVQVGRGVVNTGEAIAESVRGDKDWDEVQRKWIKYDLDAEAARATSMTEAEYIKENSSASAATAPATKEDESEGTSKTVKDDTYYKVLGVDPGASRGKIRKAFFKQARVMHPDKNQDDPKAKEKFQKLNEAYHVLSDPELRRRYDAQGQGGVEEESKMAMNSAALFAMIFGSDKFESLIGELRLMQGMDMAAHSDASKEAAASAAISGSLAMDFRQWQREVKCAVYLAKTLDRRLAFEAEADKDEKEARIAFESAIAEETKSLAEDKFGRALLSVIGYIYIEQAMINASVVTGAMETVKRQGHHIGNYARMLSSGVRAIGVARDVVKTTSANEDDEKKKKTTASSTKEEEKEEDDKEKKDSFESFASVMGVKQTSILIETLWHGCVLDIESTLRRVCWKVLHDRSASSTPSEAKRVLRKRIDSLLVVGRIFRRQGLKNASEGIASISERVHTDMMMAMQQQQQEHNRTDGAASKPVLGVREMRSQLRAKGVDTSKCVERADVERLYREHFGHAQ